MGREYANIIVDISHEKLDKTFQYRIPERLQDQIEPGMRVMIPFGAGNKLIQGYVMECGDTPEYDPGKLKEIESVAAGQVTAESTAIRLAVWMKEQYGSTTNQALKMVLPVKKTVKGIVKKTIVSNMDRARWQTALEGYERKHQEARIRLAKELMEQNRLPYELVTDKLGVSSAMLRSMEEKGQIRVESENQYRNPIGDIRREEPLALSSEQQAIVDDIMSHRRKGHGRKYLIQGITGSGKTLVYIHLIRQVIEMGQQAIVLIPEIALTYQTVLRFYKAFGDRVTVVNSRLSPGEKYDQFMRAKQGEVDVVIGPRSALFVPFERLGMIIMDEEHEGSYKSETMPKYHAREVAFELASYYNASVVLGSATPSLEANYLCEQGQMTKYRLTRRLTGGTLPEVHIADMRRELKEGNRSIFSRQLHEMMEERLRRKEQIILFLNRRGYSGFVSCRTCGEVMQCPHCDVSLSEHRNGTLVCHYCGYTIRKPETCPSCNSRYLMGFKAGTQQIEEALWREFPEGKTLRMDADTTRQKDSYEEILSAFANREADILIGTQMIVKGHDFPGVTLVGILAADLSLHVNDFRAGERTFQLLTQAAGRAGRGQLPGDVVIQTYQPEDMYIQYASRQDYDGFYREELEYRELMEYPPVAHMMCVQAFATEERRGLGLITKLTKELRIAAKQGGSLPTGERKPEPGGAGTVSVIGPAPAGVGKVKDVYRFVSYVKSPDRQVLVRLKDDLERVIRELPLTDREYVQFDFDPMNI